MNRKIAVLALLWCAACYSGDPSLGNCNSDADCTLAGATCNRNHQCEYACSHICDLAEACVNGACELQGPKITSASAPATWSLPSQPVTVTAVVDDTGGPGIVSATLRIAGKADIAGTTTDAGLIRTYTFSVPGSVQAADSEVPVNFTVVATDTKGGTTPDRAAGTGQLRIDGSGPTVTGVTVNGGVAVGPAGQQIKWFAQSQTAPIDVQVSIQDAGSGVQPSSLTLVVGTRIDTGTPTCTAATAQALTCHFAVPPATIPTTVVPAGGQRQLLFAVAGTDVAGNAVKTNQAAVGIDGKPPTITFTVGSSGTTTTYPPANADCNGNGPNGGTADANLFCGHDGNHFWRAGDGNHTFKFTVSDVYASPDASGSGADPAAGKCTINGVTTCTVTYDAQSGNFTFPADLSGGTFASGVDGTANLNVAVDAKDAVGNVATQVTASVAVTRVKWMRKVAITATAGAPVLSAKLGQVIVAGTVVSGDPIVAVKTTDGAIAWSTGGSLSPPVTAVTTNMALDTTTSTDAAHPTPVLYVNSGDNFYALHIGDGLIDKYCTSSITGLTGSPMIFGAGASALAVVAGTFTVHAYALKPTGGGCTEDIPFAAVGTTTHPTFGPPSANGNGIYFGYDNSANATSDLGIRSFQFDRTAFSAPNSRNLGKQPTAVTLTKPAAITPAADLFFGVNNDHTFFRHSPDLAPLSWPISGLSSAQNIVSQPLVSGNLMFAMSNTLTAFRLDNAGTAWAYGTGLTEVSPPTLATTTIFVSDQFNRQMVALNASDRFQRWAYTGSATTPTTRMSSVATEAALGADGVLYFGDSGGRLYALFVDDTPLSSAAGDWPRTGYDNCNSNHSNNTGFVCQ